MLYRERYKNNIKPVGEIGVQDRVVECLYGTGWGMKLVGWLSRPLISAIGGELLSTKASALLIPRFIKANGIKMEDFQSGPFQSFNDFFIRPLKKGARQVDLDKTALVSPCDGKLTVYRIDHDAVFRIKRIYYTMEELTRSKKVAEAFAGGTLMVFRLSVEDYHRYVYVDDGIKTKNYRIPGVYHTVNPSATDRVSVYRENQRSISILKSENFGAVMMMEVGAMMVGKIVNYHGEKAVKRGEEKGRFEFGGSTIILALKEGVARIDRDIMDNSFCNIETKVKLGEKIGTKIL